MPNDKGGINATTYSGDSEGDAVRRQNLASESVAGSTAGVGGSTARSFDERAKYRRSVATKPPSTNN
jgi:hypothetical protein